MDAKDYLGSPDDVLVVARNEGEGAVELVEPADGRLLEVPGYPLPVVFDADTGRHKTLWIPGGRIYMKRSEAVGYFRAGDNAWVDGRGDVSVVDDPAAKSAAKPARVETAKPAAAPDSGGGVSDA